MALGRKINSSGVVESNSVIFHFLLPSFFAAIVSAITQGIGNTSASFQASTDATGTTSQALTYNKLVQPGRTSSTVQGGYQIVAWSLSVGMGAAAGLILGIIYSLINDHEAKTMFDDAALYGFSKGDP